MENLNIKQLSTRFSVQKMGMEDAGDIYDLTSKNLQFYEYCGRRNTLEDIYTDMTVTPPGKGLDDKYYVGFFDGAELVAVMDLIAGYPDESTAFIGFFMMNADYQGKGIGSEIISGCCVFLKSIGFTTVRLGFDKENPQSGHFWYKNHFEDVRVCPQPEGIIVLAERRL